MELKNKVESVLFSAGKRMHIDELVKLCRSNKEEVQQALKELRDDYDTKNASLMVAEEGDFWKLTVREKYLGLVRKIVTATELSKTLMETLAVIAWKAPVKQSDVIKIRTNKAYDHLRELEEAGYITREKHGRTKLIKLAQRFFEYFDIPEDKLKEKFKNVDQMAKAIEAKEQEIEDIKKEQARKAREEKEKEVDLIDDKGHKIKLKEYELSDEQKQKALKEEPRIEPAKETIGDLEVVDEEPEAVHPQEKKSKPKETEVKEEQEEELPEEEPEEPEQEEAPEEESKESESNEPEEEEEPEIEEALEEIKEEQKEQPEQEEELPEEEPEEQEQEPAQSEDDFEKKAEKRAQEILSSPADEELTPEVEAELDSMLHPSRESEMRSGPSDEQEPGLQVPTDKPDFKEEVEDLVESAGEEKVELPKKAKGIKKGSDEEEEKEEEKEEEEEKNQEEE